MTRLVADPVGFDRDIWGRTSARTARGSSITDVFDLGAVDALLASGTRTPAVRMVRAGSVLNDQEFCTPTRVGGRTLYDVVDPRLVARQLANGATLVLQSLETTWPPVAGFLDSLRRDSRHQCRANAYLTPANSSGFSSHRDRHDVFVAQLTGSKEWTIGDEVLTMERGDVVYIPAGIAHSAAARDAPSLHLTIGVFPTRMDAVVDECLECEPLLARRAPFGAQPSSRAIHATLDAALDTLHDAAYPPRRGSTVSARLSTRSFIPFDRRGLVVGAMSWATVDADSTVRWATVAPTWQPSETPGVDRVLLYDRVLRIPSVVRPEIERIASAPDGIAVANLVGLSAASRVTVARRLVREGACVIATTVRPQ
jgi:mannose-6-phosphate isomerase-like protein (cupin superfamily)